MPNLERCQYGGCQKFADVLLDGFGWACYDHYEVAKLKAAADWQCDRCLAWNPQIRGGRAMEPLRLGFCLKCLRDRGPK